ncbi:hypothetical protein [Streptomyces sp. NPDC058304]|uniref:hypothetical protein n=1 Tax=Streptomyces sp. NPDC058304 TaxID=3346437 RepID=UPI0036ED9B82
MTTSRSSTAGRRFDAVLCDLDNVIRFYDPTRPAELERAAGTPQSVSAVRRCGGAANPGRVSRNS